MEVEAVPVEAGHLAAVAAAGTGAVAVAVAVADARTRLVSVRKGFFQGFRPGQDLPRSARCGDSRSRSYFLQVEDKFDLSHRPLEALRYFGGPQTLSGKQKHFLLVGVLGARTGI